MKKDLLVSFKVGNQQEVWIQHPDLSAAIHANEAGHGNYNDVLCIAATLTEQHLKLNFDRFDLDEIHDGDATSSIELWDYSSGANEIAAALI